MPQRTRAGPPLALAVTGSPSADARHTGKGRGQGVGFLTAVQLPSYPGSS